MYQRTVSHIFLRALEFLIDGVGELGVSEHRFTYKKLFLDLNYLNVNYLICESFRESVPLWTGGRETARVCVHPPPPPRPGHSSPDFPPVVDFFIVLLASFSFWDFSLVDFTLYVIP